MALRGWSDLPVEMRHEVIKKLNWADRNSLRNVSKFDRLIVDSMKQTVKVVRVLDWNHSCQSHIFVFLGVGDYIKIWIKSETVNGPIEMITDRSESDKREIIRETFPETHRIKFLADVIRDLFAHKNTFIEVFELDMDLKGYCKQMLGYLKEGAEKMNIGVFRYEGDNSIDGCAVVQRAQKDFSRRWNSADYDHPYSCSYVQSFITYVPPVKCGHPRLSDDPIPTVAQLNLDFMPSNLKEIDCNGRWNLHYIHELSKLRDQFMETDYPNSMLVKLCIVPSESVDVEEMFDEVQEADVYQWSEELLVKRRVNDRDEVFTYVLSQCGLCIYRCSVEREWIVRRILSRNICGLGVICARCSDRFDYWYLRKRWIMSREMEDMKRKAKTFWELQKEKEEEEVQSDSEFKTVQKKEKQRCNQSEQVQKKRQVQKVEKQECKVNHGFFSNLFSFLGCRTRRRK